MLACWLLKACVHHEEREAIKKSNNKHQITNKFEIRNPKLETNLKYKALNQNRNWIPACGDDKSFLRY
ncbi:MAG: hypothetical protein A2Y07_01820 [Planctomycetes bacterium GWF2_50_10]|nr:MAG: hypothetical protein A2Y07_01820 [Planctomycetes bacterium GWF2_50_10]